jgi:NAD(P)H-dependent FMN reductase
MILVTLPATTHVLALSGSLRAASLNSALLRVAARVAPANVSIAIYQGLEELPLFNPDIESTDPEPAARLRTHIIAADALLIASPEYAHGITGVLKNALDWMVGNESFVHKPVALLNASPLSVHAIASLREIVTTMSAHLIDEASIAVPVRGYHRSEASILADATIVKALRQSLEEIRAAVIAQRANGAQ